MIRQAINIYVNNWDVERMYVNKVKEKGTDEKLSQEQENIYRKEPRTIQFHGRIFKLS